MSLVGKLTLFLACLPSEIPVFIDELLDTSFDCGQKYDAAFDRSQINPFYQLLIYPYARAVQIFLAVGPYLEAIGCGALACDRRRSDVTNGARLFAVCIDDPGPRLIQQSISLLPRSLPSHRCADCLDWLVGQDCSRMTGLMMLFSEN